jgi:ketosteroid isomerase-like protein
MSSGNLEEDLRRTFDSYAAAFRAGDLQAISEHFAYPAFFVSDAPEVALLPVPTAEAARTACERVVKWHRDLGVANGRMLDFSVTELSPRLASVSLSNEFQDARGARVYDYQGVYTLVRRGEAWRIATISHNQIPRLLALLSH